MSRRSIPATLALNPSLANLQMHEAPGAHSDAQLFKGIKEGYPGWAMPVGGEKLTDIQRWNMVNYIRASGRE